MSVGVFEAEAKIDAVSSAARRLYMQVVAHNDEFRPDNALQFAKQYDLIIDATDNASTRYLVSDVCCILQMPLVSGAAIGTEGQLSVYCYNNGKSKP